MIFEPGGKCHVVLYMARIAIEDICKLALRACHSEFTFDDYQISSGGY